ncbi:hypothetical protein VTO73DRAFT_15215 [Trametes versicolor]
MSTRYSGLSWDSDLTYSRNPPRAYNSLALSSIMPIAISIPSLPSIVPDWLLEHNFGALASRMATISNTMERRSLEIIVVSNSTRLPKVGYTLVGEAVEGEDIMSLLREQASCIRDQSGRRLLIEKTFKIKADMAPSDNEKHTGEELAAQMSYIFPRLPRPPRSAPDFARLYSAAPSYLYPRRARKL